MTPCTKPRQRDPDTQPQPLGVKQRRWIERMFGERPRIAATAQIVDPVVELAPGVSIAIPAPYLRLLQGGAGRSIMIDEAEEIDE